jgi:hypothetical protein
LWGEAGYRTKTMARIPRNLPNSAEPHTLTLSRLFFFSE